MNTKCCRECSIEFPATLTHFYKKKSGKYGLTGRCRSCICEKTRRWVMDNPERKKQMDRDYAQRNPERMAATKKRWVENNPDKKLQASRDYRKRNPGQNTSNAAKWRKDNPVRTRAIKSRRRAKERGLPTAFTADDWKRALDHFNHCCAVCGRSQGLWHTLAADHWIPVTSPDCPGTVPENIVPLCHGHGGCNNSKSNHEPIEWLINQVGKKKAQLISERISQYFDLVRSKS